MKRWLLGLLLLVFVVGCGAPTLDTTSEESMKKSIDAMGAKLTDQEKGQLAGALLMHTMSKAFSAEGAGGDQKPHEICKELHGLTAEQIIAKGKAQVDAMGKEAKP
jgi:hypothetical protein